ncbi:MAG: SprB repeat-containing protein [Flavobacterium sp.]
MKIYNHLMISRFYHIIVFVIMLGGLQSFSQTTTFQTIPSGSYIVNMGVSPQTINNGLRPYGLLYALLSQNCPVHWAINPNKTKDGIDFSHAGVDYRGGAFIVEAKYRTSQINTIITNFQTQGVVGTTITSPANNVPIFLTFNYVPRWTLDKQNGSIATTYFVNANIPPAAHGGSNKSLWKDPVELVCCDDVFVMPHADPVWATHQRLLSWNLDCKGAIWAACHAVGYLENMVNPANRNEQTNFLSVKDPAWTGTTGSYALSNSLITTNNHSGGTPPYSFNNDYASHPVGQFLGSIDAATQNGSEQIYMPRQGILSNPSTFSPSAIARWRPETNIIVFDPTQVNVTNPDLNSLKNIAAVLVYGKGFGDPNRGEVMYMGGHSHSRSTGPANVAAQRAFFNFSFYTLWERSLRPQITNLPDIIYADEVSKTLGFNLSYNNGDPLVGTPPTVNWTSTCGGSFQTSSSNPTTFNLPSVGQNTECTITLNVTDDCGRQTFDSKTIILACRLDVTTTVTNPCNNVPNSGSINITPSFGVPGYTWSYVRLEGGTGNGTGTTIPNLSAGTYNVTFRDKNGQGCIKTFTINLIDSPAIEVVGTAQNISCNGLNNGSININVSGGTPGYIFLWNDNVTTQNRTNLTAGNYSVIVTDTRGCNTTRNFTITEPSLINATTNVTNVSCFSGNNGAITINVTGGNSPYAFLWNDGVTSQNRTNLVAGTYSVTITDSNNCTRNITGIQVTQPLSALSIQVTQIISPDCVGSSSGGALIQVSGGTSPYQYQWRLSSNPTVIANTANLSNVSAGNYTLTVIDANGCSTIQNVIIPQIVSLAANPNKVDPTCPPNATNANSDGSIQLNLTGGTAPYQVTWTTSNGIIPSGQQNNMNLTGLTTGTYQYQVSDANGCSISGNVTLINTNPLPTKPVEIKNQ